jgi:y4mF family transcriptional regulator
LFPIGSMSGASETIGAFVRRRRRANKLSQAELGLLAGVGRRFVSDLERGKPTNRLDKVDAVLRVFGKKIGVVDRGSSEARG